MARIHNRNNFYSAICEVKDSRATFCKSFSNPVQHYTDRFDPVSYTHLSWKVVIPKALETEVILDYHSRYGHMGALKVMKALEEHTLRISTGEL